MFLRESGGVRGGGREAFFKKIPSASLKTAHFTLIELPGQVEISGRKQKITSAEIVLEKPVPLLQNNGFADKPFSADISAIRKYGCIQNCVSAVIFCFFSGGVPGNP